MSTPSFDATVAVLNSILAKVLADIEGWKAKLPADAQPVAAQLEQFISQSFDAAAIAATAKAELTALVLAGHGLVRHDPVDLA